MFEIKGKKPMFVDIETPKKPLEVEKIYNPYYRGGEEITPEVCLEVLESTNYAACVKRMLTCVERLPVERQGAFKEVVIATFMNREQPDEVAEIGMRLAAASGYADELRQTKDSLTLGDVYVKSAPGVERFFVFHGERCANLREDEYAGVVFTNDKVDLSDMRLSGVLDLSRCEKVSLSNADMAGVSGIKFKDGAIVSGFQVQNLPEGFDVSNCRQVNLEGCELGRLNGLRFREGATVYLSYAKSLPKDLDLSACAVAGLGLCDLSHIKEMRFKGCVYVNLGEAKNLPEKLVFEDCQQVCLSNGDFKNVKELKFENVEKLNLAAAQNFAERVDLSTCQKVQLSESDMSGVKEMTFKKGAEVIMNYAHALPECLDVSECKRVGFVEANRKGLKKIKFADRTQMNASFFESKYRKVEVSFAKDSVFDRMINTIKGKGR